MTKNQLLIKEIGNARNGMFLDNLEYLENRYTQEEIIYNFFSIKLIDFLEKLDCELKVNSKWVLKDLVVEFSIINGDEATDEEIKKIVEKLDEKEKFFSIVKT